MTPPTFCPRRRRRFQPSAAVLAHAGAVVPVPVAARGRAPAPTAAFIAAVVAAEVNVVAHLAGHRLERRRQVLKRDRLAAAADTMPLATILRAVAAHPGETPGRPAAAGPDAGGPGDAAGERAVAVLEGRLRQALERTALRPLTPLYAQLSDVLQRQLSGLITGSGTAEVGGSIVPASHPPMFEQNFWLSACPM